MPGKSKKLGRQLLEALEEATNLMAATIDPERLEQLIQVRAKLREQLARLVDEHLDERSKKYKDATAGLRDASRRARAAVKGLEAVAGAIRALARAAELAAKLA
jgi:hypothetical protein